jgi:hypothetical protein
MPETKTVKITCGTAGALVALVGSHLPMVLADDVDLDMAEDGDFRDVPVVWLDFDGAYREQTIDIRLLVDWEPPKPREPNKEILEFFRELVARYAPPPQEPASTAPQEPASTAPTWPMWPENAPGEAPEAEPEALHVPSPGESVERCDTVLDDPSVQCAIAAAQGVSVAAEAESFTSDDPRAPWNAKRRS